MVSVIRLGCGRAWFDIGFCCFSAKHAVLRSKTKDWLAPNVSEWSDIYP